jgi:hypothetical protein
MNTSLVGIEELTAADFTIFPNPATESVTITFKEETNGSLSVYDLSGKVVATQTLSGVNGTQAVEINTSALNSGLYTINVTANGTSVSKKLAIRK